MFMINFLNLHHNFLFDLALEQKETFYLQRQSKLNIQFKIK